MPVVPIITEKFRDRRYLRQDSYRFAARDMLVPIVLKELWRVVMQMPIGFAQYKSGYLPVAVLGFGSKVNLFVGSEGQWLAPYIPAAYRAYPFNLVTTSNQESVLCIDEDSQSVNANDGEPFYGDNGQPSEWLESVLKFLGQLDKQHRASQAACAKLNEHGLLEAWRIQVQTPQGPQDRVLEGLFCVNQNAFKATSPEVLAQLRDSGALLLIHCQLLSVQHLLRLSELAGQRASADPASLLPVDLDQIDLSFDGVNFETEL